MKKVISLLLCVVLAFSLNVACFASYATGKCDCGVTPVVYVTGFASEALVAEAGTENQYGIFPPETSKINEAVVHTLLPIVELAVTGDYEAFSYSLCDIFNELMADVACDDNGEPVNQSTGIEPLAEPNGEHGYRCDKKFKYDWRMDVFDIAELLNTYIEKTKAATGHDKVVLKGESMGGAVIMTYLKVYGYESVDTVIMQSSAFNGIELVGGLFTGDVLAKPESVVNYIGNFIEGSDPVTVLLRYFYRLFASALISPVCKVVNKTFDDGKEIIYENCLCDMFGNLAGIWCFVPNEYYEQAKAYMLDETENASLIKKLDAYHYGVMDSTKEIMDNALAHGVKLAIISNYGKAAVPVLTNDGYQSDFLIDTSRTSLGATCALFGSTLGEDYTQKVNDGHNHLSCDGVIDASTCLYPEYTWFIKDMLHTGYTDGYYDFTWKIAQFDEQITIKTLDEFPQFLYNDTVTETLQPLTPENCDTQSTQVDIGGVVRQILNFLTEASHE